MDQKLKSDIHYFFLNLGYKCVSSSTYEKGNVVIEFEDFYHQIFKYYEDDKLKYVNQDDLDVKSVKNILRGININSLLD